MVLEPREQIDILVAKYQNLSTVKRKEYNEANTKNVFIKSSENTPQLAAEMNRRVGWQAASLGAAKRI